MNLTIRRAIAPLALSVGLVAGTAACGSSGSDSASTTTAAASGASTTVAADGGSTTTEATTTDVAKVSANDASQSEIAAALTAAGVENADRWADEVTEYRPYSDADQGFPSLRKELEKYNPTTGTIDKIISVLK